MSELWDVEVGYGQIHTMTLDDLDAAYQAGKIVETTRVKEHGATTWSTLAVVAGLEEEAAPSLPPPSMPVGPTSLSPTALSLSPPTPSTGFDLTPQPPAFDLDDLDESNPKFKKSKLGMVLGGIGIAAVIGLAAFAVPKALRAADASQSIKAASASKTTSFDPRSAIAVTEDDVNQMRQKLTDEQRRRLEEADKRRAEEIAKKNAEAAQKAAEAAAKRGPARKGGKTTEPFVKGGNKFDPLNGSL